MNLFCEGLAVSYGDRPVLRECALSLRSGELVFLLGVNGAGKSTLLKSLAGLLPPEADPVSWGSVWANSRVRSAWHTGQMVLPSGISAPHLKQII